MAQVEKRKRDIPVIDGDTDDGSCSERPTASSKKRKRVIGPSLPSTTDNSREDKGIGNETDSDDDIGPRQSFTDAIPPEKITGQETPSVPLEPPHDKEGSACDGVRRDEWMIRPPGPADWTTRIDTTKLRNRRFQSGRYTNRPPGQDGPDKSWTESPEEKTKRLQDKVMGITTPGPENQPKITRPSGMLVRKSQKHNDASTKRGSLYRDLHGQPREKLKDDQVRTFDRETDMALASRLSDAQRQEVLNKASEFGSRFTKGNFL